MIAWTSVVAIAVGTASLMLVLSVFNGFEGLVKSLYSDFYPQLRIAPVEGKYMNVSDTLQARLSSWPGVRAMSRVVEEKAILQNGQYQSVIQLKGVDDRYASVSGVPARIYHGAFSLGSVDAPAVVLGAGVEDALGVHAGREVVSIRAFLPRRGGGKSLTMENIQESSFYPAGSFMIQQDFDEQYGLTRYDFLRDAMGLPVTATSFLEIGLDEERSVDRIKKEMRAFLGPAFRVEDRYEQNQALYGVMNAERWIVYGVLSLILVVGAFTMIGALTMLILEKQADIQILRALGADAPVIRRIFLTEGLLLAAVGGGIGMLLAGALIWAQQTFHLIPLGGGSFLIDHYPVAWRERDVLLIGATVFLIAGLASWLPAAKAAARVQSLRTQ